MGFNWVQLLFAILQVHYFTRVDSLACDSNEIQCRNGACISLSWKCDGEDDCGDNSDEDTCPKKDCVSSDFACKNGRCIPKVWTCDKADDCGDNSDESTTDGAMCSKPTCAPTDFQCNVTKVCLKNALRCDGRKDCGFNDNSDEEGCEPTCRTNEFKCGNGKCIDAKFRCNRIAECNDASDEKNCNLQPCEATNFKCNESGHCIEKHLQCDGSRDCLDGSDELNCQATTTEFTTPAQTTSIKAASTTPKPCMHNHFRCTKSRKCIHRSWLCDGEPDCIDGEDESQELCAKRTCSPSQFACKNGKCIQNDYKCDSINQCGDNSDEENCGTLKPTKCTALNFQCGTSSVCIEQSLVCNGKKDCPGGEDEPVNCGRNECTLGHHGCSQNCTDLKIGYKCSCVKGFHLLPDNKTCVNTNECHQHGICSQRCVDLKGSYKCLCFDGYLLDGDMKTCRASGNLPELMIAMRSQVRQLRTDGQHYKTLVHTRFVEAVMSLDIDVQGKMVYLADLGNQSIIRASLEKEDTVKHVVKNVQKPEGIAFDWISKKIYWSSTHPKYQGSIEVSNADGSSRSVLVHSKVEEPRAVAVHPIKRLLFWTDWGKHPRIERVSMDGLQRHVVIDSSQLTWPNGLTIDYTSDRIFWADSKRNYIGSSNLEGTDVVIVVGSIQSPYGLAVFEDSIYWTNYRGGQVFRANKFTGSNRHEYQDGFFSPMDLQIMHPLLQKPAANPCSNNNGGCSHLCLLSSVKPEGYSCACPTDVKLYPDNKHCDIVYPTTTNVFTTNRKDLYTSTISTSPKGCHDKDFYCPSSRKCIPASKLCNGYKDCPNNEDEELERCNSVELLGSKKSGSGANRTPLIAGIIAGIACIVLVVIVIVLIVYRRKRSQSNLSITFHQRDEFLGVQTVKLNSSGSNKKLASKNFDNINYFPASERDELITDPCLMNVPDDSSSDNGSTCDETKPVMKHQNSSSSNSVEC